MVNLLYRAREVAAWLCPLLGRQFSVYFYSTCIPLSTLDLIMADLVYLFRLVFLDLPSRKASQLHATKTRRPQHRST